MHVGFLDLRPGFIPHQLQGPHPPWEPHSWVIGTGGAVFLVLVAQERHPGDFRKVRKPGPHPCC